MNECLCTLNIQYHPDETQFSDGIPVTLPICGLSVTYLSKLKPRFRASSDDVISACPIWMYGISECGVTYEPISMKMKMSCHYLDAESFEHNTWGSPTQFCGLTPNTWVSLIWVCDQVNIGIFFTCLISAIESIKCV